MKQILFPVAIAVANLLAAGTASAYVPPVPPVPPVSPVPPGPPPTSTGPICSAPLTGGGVTILECAAKRGGTYDITNKSGADIYSFAVSTQNDPKSKPFGPFNTWSSQYVSEAAWDKGRAGSFDATFGTTDTGAYLFSTSTNPILNDGKTWKGQFGFSFGDLTSNFVAYGQNGTTVIAQSFTTAVPEPETYAMLLAGLGVLGFMGKRRKTN